MPAKATYSAGTAFLTVVPSFLGIEDAFKQQVGKLAEAADKDIAAGVARGLKEAGKQARGTGAAAGKDFAGAYGGEVKKRIDAVWQGLPTPDPEVKLTKWEKALDQVRSNMKELAEQRIGIDIDKATFDKAVDDARKQLVDLRTFAAGPNKDRNFYNANQAIKGLDNLQQFTRDATRQAATAGDQAASAFNQRMAKVLRDGLAGLPPIKITANSSDAERALSELQRRMVALESKTIGVNISAAEAYTELRGIHSELVKLDRTDVDVAIRTNAHEAASGMGQFIQQAEQAGRSTDGIGQRANLSMSRLEYLIAVGASLGTSIVPAALAAAGAVGMIGTAGISAVAGLGVFALGTSGVADAVKALNGYQEDQAKSASNAGQAQRRMANSANQVRMAQLSLANTRRQIAEQEEDSARRVADSERAVADARRQGRIDLVEQARAVRDSQRAVTDSEEDALDVRRALNAVIRDATRDIQELDVALSRNKVDQQKAVTDQMAALEELNALRANPRATEVELRRAQDAYDEQTVRIQELQQKHQQLSEDKAKADKLGVEGDERVIQARERVADADERVAKAREKVVREQEQQREIEYRSRRRIEDAQRQADTARREQARQQLDAEFQLAQAINSVEEAQRGQAAAWEQSGTASSAALDKLNKEMGDLGPAGQRFAYFLHELKDEARGLRDAAAEPLLPDLQTAITMMLPYLPALEGFIGKVADTMGDLAIASVEALGNPVWQRFFSYIDRAAVPSLLTMFEVGSNLTEGLISLFLALTPLNEQAGTGLVELSRDFALWAERLNKSQGYQEFLEYVRENGPRVVQFLGEVGELLIDLVEAAAPIGAVVLQGITLLIDALNSIPTGVLTALVLGFGAMALVISTLGLVMRGVKFRDQLRDIVTNSNAFRTYAVETGRAADKTTLFGQASATAGGMAATAKDRVAGMATSVSALGTRMTEATTGTGPLGRGLDSVRVAALGAAVAANGPGGLAGGLQAAGTRMGELGTSATTAANGGLARAKVAALELAAAANGPGGLAAGAQAAGGRLTGLGRAAGGAATSIGTKLMNGLGSAAALLGGPWGVALAGATIGLTYFSTQAAKQNERVNSLAAGLALLNEKYVELGGKSTSAGGQTAQALKDIVQNNPELQRAVVELDKLGIGFDEMVTSVTSGDPAAVVNALNAEIEKTIQLAAESKKNKPIWELGDVIEQDRKTDARVKSLTAMRDAWVLNAEAMGVAATSLDVLTAADRRNLDLALIRENRPGIKPGDMDKLTASYDRNATQISALTGLVEAFGAGQNNAALKAKALTTAISAQTGAAIEANEASEAWHSSLISLRESVAANGKTVSEHTRAGLSNRDAIQAAAQAAQARTIADIAAGKPMKDVTGEHEKRIEALKKEARELGILNPETLELIELYGEVPENIKTVLTETGMADIKAQLRDLQARQYALIHGLDPDVAVTEFKKDEALARRGTGRAFGGPIHGPGTKTSDSVPIMASRGEFMQQAAAVDYYGTNFMWALNRREVPKEALPGYATGGLIGTPKAKDLPGYAAGGLIGTNVQWPMVVNAKKTKIPDERDLIKAIGGAVGGALLAGDGSVAGWRAMERVMEAAVEGMTVTSAQKGRSGDGYHPKGRAIDMVFSDGSERRGGGQALAAFNFIASRYGKGTKELIWDFSPWGLSTGIWNGDRHRFQSSTSGPGSHDDHLHWAYDQGGWLMPGYGNYVNMTGQPEAVLNPQQWRAIETFVQQGMAGGGRQTHHHYDFANSTLDEQRIRDMQARDDAMNRVDRPW